MILSKEALRKFKVRFSRLEATPGKDDVDDREGTLKELAKRKERRLRQYAKLDSTADPVLNTALVINWRWEAADKRIKRFCKKFPEINTLRKLKNRIQRTDPVAFCKKYLCINASSAENPKYQLLCKLCDGFLEYKKNHHLPTEKEAMLHWARNFELRKIKSDPIGKLPGVGPATVQNLRMLMGMNVVKPDRNVLNVLRKEFGISIKCTQLDDLAKELGLSPIYLDKVLYEYGQNKAVS